MSGFSDDESYGPLSSMKLTKARSVLTCRRAIRFAYRRAEESRGRRAGSRCNWGAARLYLIGVVRKLVYQRRTCHRRLDLALAGLFRYGNERRMIVVEIRRV